MDQSSSCPQSPSGMRVDSLPYWAESYDIPCMYAGNMLSSDKYENYFFYWLMPNPDTSSSNNSLIIYLNGGPGSTSMNALFTGNGPLRVTETGTYEDFAITYDEDNSWVGLGDLMWIDQPVGTGWSYGEHAATTLDEIGSDMVTFLLNFYEEFPAYKTRDLVLTGESFAGKYLSYSAKAILDYNNDASNDFQFQFTNLVLFDPLSDNHVERMHQVELPYALGMYDDFQIDQMEVLRRRCEEAPGLGESQSEISSACKNVLNYATEMQGEVYQMDARYFDVDIDPLFAPFKDMFKHSSKIDEIKDALHITKTDHFSSLNSTVASEITNRENDAAYVYTEVLAQQIPILISVGMFDMKDGVRQTLEWIKEIDFDGRETFDTQPRKNFTYYDADGDLRSGGWYRHHDYFSVIITP